MCRGPAAPASSPAPRCVGIHAGAFGSRSCHDSNPLVARVGRRAEKAPAGRAECNSDDDEMRGPPAGGHFGLTQANRADRCAGSAAVRERWLLRVRNGIYGALSKRIFHYHIANESMCKPAEGSLPNESSRHHAAPLPRNCVPCALCRAGCGTTRLLVLLGRL